MQRTKNEGRGLCLHSHGEAIIPVGYRASSVAPLMSRCSCAQPPPVALYVLRVNFGEIAVCCGDLGKKGRY